MKGLMQWFKASNKMKRWIFLIIVGIMLACYGLAEILVMKEISFQEVGKVIVIFVMGFISIVLGLIFLNKRTLEVLIESTDNRMENKKNVNVKSLIFDKTIYNQGPNIVVIGGGAGLNTVLEGLKHYTSNLTAIVTVSDYGEEMTDSRRELGVMPLEDIKDSMVSLAAKEGQVDKLFNYQFQRGRLKGLQFSDIYFSAMKDINGNFEDSIIKSNEVVNIIGKVLPVTLEEMKIVAELANGYMVEEKSRIAQVVSEKVTKINRILLSPSNCKPAPGVIEAIKKADCIIIGPGSLYTNVIPNLLINAVTKAIKESSAIKVYISNIMTEPGQTDNYTVSDHLNAIIDHCGQGVVDYCIYDTGEIIPEFIKKYNLEGQDLVEQDIEKVKGVKFLQRNLSMIKDEFIRHDPNLVASSIIELVCDDLKYQDKQNEPQYMMLNTKLREEKRINKIKRSMKKKEMRQHTDPAKEGIKKGKSKFSNKYSDRIASIREADQKLKHKIEKEKKTSKLEKKTKEELEDRLSNLRQEKTQERRVKGVLGEQEEKQPKSTKKQTQIRTRRTQETMETPKKENQKPKSARGRKKSPQKIREEMLKQLENSKWK